MTRTAVINTQISDGREAGNAIGSEALDALGGSPPDALVVFASPAYDPEVLLAGIYEKCRPGALAGCSSAGEFTFDGTLPSSVVALAIRSDSMRFKVHVGRRLGQDARAAARELASTFDMGEDEGMPHRTALVLADTLAGFGEEFLHSLTEETGGRYQMFGGGAADEARFEKTYVFAGREALSDAAVALEIISADPIGIGVSHGWTPGSPQMTVTKARGLRLQEIDGRPAAEVIAELARKLTRRFDREDPLPFFLHHVLGIEDENGFRLRVPLGVDEEGALVCAAEIPQGSRIRLMRTRSTSAAEAARVAASRARTNLQGGRPGTAIFFDCAATRLRLGDTFGSSVAEITDALGDTRGMGCNTFGQFARLEGQFSGYHNCTAVVCVLPE